MKIIIHYCLLNLALINALLVNEQNPSYSDSFVLDDDDHQTNRALQFLGEVYETPKWWEENRARYGKQFKRCKFRKDLAPVTGDTCPRMRVGDYFCMFGKFGYAHCEVKSVPEIRCSCERNRSTWDCEIERKSCCPTEKPKPGDPCDRANLINTACQYSIENCCGNSYPTETCQCFGSTWSCNTGSLCSNKERATCGNGGVCPSTRPGGACAVNGLQCNYGKESCCDKTFDELTCSCNSGMWACSFNDNCISGCPNQMQVHKTTLAVASVP